MIKFIYFDVGGTLLNWSGVFESAANKFNITVKNIGDVFDEYHDEITKGFMSPKEYWEKCIKKYNLKNATDFDFLDSWVSDYKPIKEVHDLARKIYPKYKIGLLSNIYKGMLPLLLEKKIIPDLNYQEIIFSCDVGMMKPEPEIYELAQKRARVKGDEILLVDDREDFLEGARKFGWQTFLFKTNSPKTSVGELEEYLSRS